MGVQREMEQAEQFRGESSRTNDSDKSEDLTDVQVRLGSSA